MHKQDRLRKTDGSASGRDGRGLSLPGLSPGRRHHLNTRPYPFVKLPLTTILKTKIVSDFPPQFAIILGPGHILWGSG
jgi:hypothetical protein